MKKQKQKPPFLLEKLFQFLLRESERVSLLGDYEELYNDLLRNKGGFIARLWYWSQLMITIPSSVVDLINWRFIMLKNYLKIALRNLTKQKAYSFINIFGLALGMTCCLFIMLWVFDEISFDRFHDNAENLYRVEQDQFYSGEIYHVTVTPYPMGPGIKEEIPEITKSTRYCWMGNLLFKYEDKIFYESGVRSVDSTFLRMLTYPLVLGDAETALVDPDGMVISEEIAEKYFGNKNPLGEMVTINTTHIFKITGVMKNLPTNTDLQFDILIPFEFIKKIGRYNDSWGSNSIVTLVQLHEKSSLPAVNKKITDVRHNHVAELFEDPEELRQFNEGQRTQFMLMPLVDVHLHQYFGYGHNPGAILYVYVFTIIAFVVLLIACINFMNLATARSANRAKEVGLRKVVGAVKKNLIGQFYGESILMACLALVFAFLITVILLPKFNVLAEKKFTVTDLYDIRFLIGMFLITLCTGILAGSYPALFLSSFKPVKVLKGALSGGTKSALFRKALVLTQFILSIFLIIGTSVIFKQLTFMQNKKLGYDKEHVIYLPLRGETRESYQVLKNALKKDPHVVNVSASMAWPANFGSNSSGAEWDGYDPNSEVLISTNTIDFDYIETMGIELISGRSHSKRFASDTSGAFLINEELQRIMGKEDATNERFKFWGIEGKIIGVMKNFHFQSMRNEIEPLALWIIPGRIQFALVRLESGNITASLEAVEKIWEQTIPDYPYEYTFLDEALQTLYESEKTIGTLLQVFTFLAMIIACLGLFGLASFTAEQRTKEIGVRKTLGATVVNIVFLLTREFAKWVIVANVIAWPVSYLILRSWLQNYAFRTQLSWWIFAGSGVLALILAIATVSYQAMKAALANPAEALKYE